MCNYAGGKTEDERMCIRRQRNFSMDNVTLKKVTQCSHLKYNIFTGCGVLSVKILMSEKINEWLKTKFEISFLHMSNS